MSWTNPDDAALKALLSRARTLAIVGASPDPSRPVFHLMGRLKGKGFRTIPIGPQEGQLLGEPYVPSLAALPAPVDVVNVFLEPERVPAAVDELVDELLEHRERLGNPALWLQDGVIAPAAAARAREAGLTVVMNKCLFRAWDRLSEDPDAREAQILVKVAEDPITRRQVAAGELLKVLLGLESRKETGVLSLTSGEDERGGHLVIERGRLVAALDNRGQRGREAALSLLSLRTASLALTPRLPAGFVPELDLELIPLLEEAWRRW